MLVHTMVGSALVAGGAAALNQVSEGDLDERMLRTRGRPIPAGRLQPTESTWFGVLLAIAGLAQLTRWVNPTAAVVALATLVSYAFIYTPLKRRTHWALLVGAVPGALPVVIGWAAASSLSAGAWALFALVFVWQLPHFLALTWLYRADFERAGLPLLAITDPDGHRLTRHLLVYSVLLLPASLTPYWTGLGGQVFAVGTVVAGLGLLGLTGRFATERSSEHARALFRATLVYLPVVWGLLLVDRV